MAEARISAEREWREKSLSDERSISHGPQSQWKSGGPKPSVVVAPPQNALEDRLRETSTSEAELEALGFQLRPKFGEKFSSEGVREVIKSVLSDFFQDKDRKEYNHEDASKWVEILAKELNERVRELNYPRYKLVGHVVLGEVLGGGIHVGMKGYWDADTDKFASYTHLGDKLFCVASVCGVYFYS